MKKNFSNETLAILYLGSAGGIGIGAMVILVKCWFIIGGITLLLGLGMLLLAHLKDPDPGPHFAGDWTDY
jgi:hypothetical protein